EIVNVERLHVVIVRHVSNADFMTRHVEHTAYNLGCPFELIDHLAINSGCSHRRKSHAIRQHSYSVPVFTALSKSCLPLLLDSLCFLLIDSARRSNNTRRDGALLKEIR